MPKFELVVPAYNESKNLEMVVKRAVDAAVRNQFTPNDFQFVVVNNGSKDNSTEVLSILLKGEFAPWFRVVNVEINQGYGYGVWQGLKSTSADIIGWSHADMQCDPADAIKAFRIVSENLPQKVLVKGVRSGRDWKDRFVSRFFEFLGRLILGLRVYEINAQPKVFSRELLPKIANPPFTFAFDMYVLYQAQKQGYQLKTISVDFPPRIHGVSHWGAVFFSRYKTIFGIIRYMFRLRKNEGAL